MGEAILRDFISNPHDDLPRFVYADWLEEQGRLQEADWVRTQLRSLVAALATVAAGGGP